MVRNELKKDEITMLREYQTWLLCVVIPGAYHAATEKQEAWTDYDTIDNTLEQLFDIAYQINMLEAVDYSQRVEKRKAFNANKRRVKLQTFLPYENE